MLANLVLIEVLFFNYGTGKNEILTVAKFFGLHASLIMLCQLVLIARLPWLDRRVGMDRLTSWHRWVGFALWWTVLTHATIVVLGYAALDGVSPGRTFLALAAGSALLVLGCIEVMRRQLALFTMVLAVGALCWLAGNAVWLAGGELHAAVPLWLAFLVLTIAGERLELTRFLPARPAAAPLFVAITAVVLAGAAITPWDAEVGTVVFAAGLLALSAWLLAYDIARHNARRPPASRAFRHVYQTAGQPPPDFSFFIANQFKKHCG